MSFLYFWIHPLMNISHEHEHSMYVPYRGTLPLFFSNLVKAPVIHFLKQRL